MAENAGECAVRGAVRGFRARTPRITPGRKIRALVCVLVDCTFDRVFVHPPAFRPSTGAGASLGARRLRRRAAPLGRSRGRASGASEYNGAKLLGRGLSWMSRSLPRRWASCPMTALRRSRASNGSLPRCGAGSAPRRAGWCRSCTAWWSTWGATTSSPASWRSAASWCAPPTTLGTAKAFHRLKSWDACPWTARTCSSRTFTSCARP